MSKSKSSKSSKSLPLGRSRRFVSLAIAAGAGMGSLSLFQKTASAQNDTTDQTYVWNNPSGGSWAAAGPSNWNDGTVNINSSFNTQVVFNTSGSQYITTADVVPNNGIFNLNSLTCSLGTSSDSVELEGAPAPIIDTLNFGPDPSNNAPQLVVSNTGTLNVQTPMIFSSGSNINVSGSASLILGSGNQGFFNFGSGTTITNSGSGNLLLGQTGSSTSIQKFSFGNNTTIINSGPGTTTLADAATYTNVSTGTITLENLGNASGGTFNIGNLGEGISGTLNIIGPITFAGSTSGNLFGNFLVLNLEANSSFNFASNGETMGGIEGSGNIIMGTAGVGVTETAAQAGLTSFNYNGSMSGTGAFTVNNASIVTLGGSNTYSGSTIIEGNSTVIATAANTFSPNSLVNVTGGNFNIGGFNQSILGLSGANLSGSLNISSATLTLTPPSAAFYAFSSPIIGNGNLLLSGIGTEDLLSSSTANSFIGTVNISSGTLRANAGGLSASNIVLGPSGTLDLVYSTNASYGTPPVTTTAGIFAKDGPGTLTFTSATSLSPTTFGVIAGNATLNYAAVTTGSEISSTTALVLGGGSLSMVGNSSVSTTQTFNGVSLGAATNSSGGAAEISVTSGSSNATNLSLGTITPNAGGTADFSTVNSGTGTASILTTNTTTNGILGGFATFNKSDWAAVSATGAVIPIAGYNGSSLSSTGSTSNNNTLLTATSNVSTGGATTYSLKFNKSSSSMTLGFNTSTDTLTIQSGGILVPSGDSSTAIGTSASPGNLAVGGNALYINQFGTSTLSILANISGGTSVVKSGPGTLYLQGTNTQTSPTYVNGGVLEVKNNNGLGNNTSAGLIINGGGLYVNGTVGTFNTTVHPLTVGPAGATFNFSGTVSFDGAGLSGIGPITLLGGEWNVGSTLSTYSGSVTLQAGVIQFTSDQFTSVTGMNVSSGAEYRIEDSGAANYGFAASVPMYISGNGNAGNTTEPGAISVIVQSATAAGPNSTFIDPVVLTGNASIGVYVQTSTNNQSQLNLTNTVSGPFTLTKVGDGILTLTNGANNYSGGTVVSAGTLTGSAGAFGTGNLTISPTTTGSVSDDTVVVNSTNSIAATAAVTVNNDPSNGNSGTLNFNGTAETIGSLSGNGFVVLNNTKGTSLTTGNATSTVFSGTISDAAGTGSLIKVGSGTFSLSGSNTYGGGTNVSAGTLLVTNTAGSATGTGPVIVGPLASLGGNGSISGPVTVNGTIAPGIGNTSSPTLLTIGSGSVLAGATVLDLTAANLSDEIAFGTGGTGTTTLGGSLSVVDTTGFTLASGQTFTLLGFQTATGSFSTSALPVLAAGLAWNTSGLYQTGTISIVTSGGVSGVWASNTSGNWETAGNWVADTAPTGAGQTATFGDSIGTVSATVTLTAPETVGILNFNGSMGGNYTLAGTNTITLSSGTSSPAVVSVNAGTQTITAPIALTAGLNINTAAGSSLVIGGTVNGGTGALTVTTGSSLTVAPAGVIGVPVVVAGNLSFANASTGTVPLVRNLVSLNVSGSVVVAAGNHATRQLISIGALSLASTGLIDLSDNDLLLQAAGGTGLSQLTSMVKQGYASGSWQGVTGITSSAAAGNATHLTALGVVLNDNGATTNTALITSFDGAGTIDGDVLVKYTYYGDTNLDGKVDGTDYSRIDSGYLDKLTGWFNGDFNYDGVIDGSDYTLIDNAYNTQGASLASEVAGPSATATAQIAGSSAVPEPATLGLLGIAAVGLLGRRRRI